MPEKRSYPGTACLTIAGQSLGLEISNPDLTNALMQRYQRFLGSGAPANVVALDVLPAGTGVASGQSASERLEIHFEAGQMRLAASNSEGYFDLQSGRGKLVCHRVRSIESIDYYLRVVYALLAYKAGGLLFHGAGIERAGQAFLFFGPSGSGKTTVSRARAGFRVLNDDLLVLMPEKGAWIAYSTPFWSPGQVKPEPASAPLAALFWLVQDRNVLLVPIGEARAIGQLVSCVPVLAAQAEFLPGLLKRCSEIAHNLPVYALHFLPDDQFWRAIELAGLVATG